MYKNKGFTLVELLAVIVILALLIVITANAVLPMMSKAKNNAMFVYASNVLNKADAAYMIDSMSNGGTAEYYSIEKLMGPNEYFGVVKVEMSGNDFVYSIALFDAKEELGLKAVNVTSSKLDGDVDDYVKNGYFTSLDTKEKYATDEDCEGYEFDLNINLIDFSKITDNYYIVGQIDYLGEKRHNGNYAMSDFIRINSNKSYKFYNKKTNTSTYAGWVWYSNNDDSSALNGGVYDNNAKSSILSNGYFILEPPENAKYLRVSWDKTYNINNTGIVLIEQ